MVLNFIIFFQGGWGGVRIPTHPSDTRLLFYVLYIKIFLFISEYETMELYLLLQNFYGMFPLGFLNPAFYGSISTIKLWIVWIRKSIKSLFIICTSRGHLKEKVGWVQPTTLVLGFEIKIWRKNYILTPKKHIKKK